MAQAGEFGGPSARRSAEELAGAGGAARGPRPARRWPIVALAAIALAGCSMPDGPGTLLVDPGRYTLYHCPDLAARWKALRTREKELRSLMDKASEGGGGAVIGAIAYRSDYESVLTEQKLVQHSAAEKNCGPITDNPADQTKRFQSDQTIR